jgi:FolB domain-containing protein
MDSATVDVIELDASVACIVGILARERVEPQPLRVALQLGLALGPTGETGDLARSVDYGAVDEQVRFLAVEGRFRLIESLALAVLRAVLLPPAADEARAAVAWAEVRIAKPAVLREAVAAVRLRRDATWAAAEPDGVLVALPEVAAHRRTLGAGEVLADGVALGIGALRGRLVLPHRFERAATVLHVTR